MGYPLQIAARYMASRYRGASVSVGTAFAILGVLLGVSSLLAVMSVTGGFQSEFRDKILGVNAHVLVLKYSSRFHEYKQVQQLMEKTPGIVAAAPFTINPMMVTHGSKTQTGVLVKGVDPNLMPKVLDLPEHIVQPKDASKAIGALRKKGAKPPKSKYDDEAVFPPVPSSGAGKGDAGADGQSGHATLLQAIEKSVKESEQQASDAGADDEEDILDASLQDLLAEADRQAALDIADAGKADAGVAGDAGADATDVELLPDGGRLVGSVVPDGGYASVLPDPFEDLPEEVAPDPCKSDEAIAQLPGVIVGTTLAKNLGLKLGSCLQVTSPTIGYSMSGGVLRPPVARQFRVVGIFSAGFDQYDSKLIYVDLYEAQRFLDKGDSVTGVEARVDDIDEAPAIRQELARRLHNKVYQTMDWRQLNHGLFTALKLQEVGMSMVLALMIVVAAFTVIAALIMMVLEKRTEIAVLKAMGMTDLKVLRIFLYQGGIIGVVGTSLGLLLGWAVCEGLRAYNFPLDPKVYFISHLPIDLDASKFLITGGFSLAVCLLATIVPALYAARMRPADGLRAK